MGLSDPQKLWKVLVYWRKCSGDVRKCLEILLSLPIFDDRRSPTYRSQVTVTSLKASEDIVVNSSPNSSLNKKINNQQAVVEIISLSLHYKYKL